MFRNSLVMFIRSLIILMENRDRKRGQIIAADLYAALEKHEYRGEVFQQTAHIYSITENH